MSGGSLLRLFQSECFSFNLLLNYLQRREEPGVHSYLVNLLYNVEVFDVDQVLPQVLNLCLHRPDSQPLERYLIDGAAKSHNFAVKLYWCLQAAAADAIESQADLIDRLLHELEMLIVNGERRGKAPSAYIPPHLITLNLSEPEDFAFSRKQIRAEYFSFQTKFAEALCRLSINLGSLKKEERDEQLRICLNNIECWMQSTRKSHHTPHYSAYTQRLFRGCVLPFKFEIEQAYHTEQLVRLLPNESFCFNTKTRVPFKLVFETISADEEDLPEVAEEVTDSTQTTVSNGLNIEAPNTEVIGTPLESESDPQFIILDDDMLTQAEFPCPWVERWNDVKERVSQTSPFSKAPSWNLRPLIVKGHDDLRQEVLAMQFIRKVKSALGASNLSLWLRPYEIMIISDNAGFIECVPDTLSLDAVKKRTQGYSGLVNFFYHHLDVQFEEAQKNFVESMAGYSLVCYLLNIKDRHNGNILLDRQGHVIHIDFGFMLSNSPGGNFNFENAPFKLTKDMLEVMGGVDSLIFSYFKILLLQGFLELRKHSEDLVLLVEMMYPGERMPCFVDRGRVLKELQERFIMHKTDVQCMAHVEALVNAASDNWRTNKYDSFQRYSNGIL
jgi:phosphatidylinositol 4-kinase